MAFELPWHLEELHNLTFTLRMRPTPIISGLLRAAKIGLASKGMTHGMTKLLCVSVRLGLYPTDICWLRLIQAPEKPGIRVRHRWLPPPPPPRFRRGRRNVFTASLKYNCLYKRGAGLSAAADCFPPFQQIYYFLSPFRTRAPGDEAADGAVASAETSLVLRARRKNKAGLAGAI